MKMPLHNSKKKQLRFYVFTLSNQVPHKTAECAVKITQNIFPNFQKLFKNFFFHGMRKKMRKLRKNYAKYSKSYVLHVRFQKTIIYRCKQ